jgi:fumarylacetoacetase
VTFPQIDETHAPSLTSWVESAAGHPDFPIQNLPLGIFSRANSTPRAGVAIGDMILDLSTAAQAGLLPEAAATVFEGYTLNAVMALPAADRLALRRAISALLSRQDKRAQVEPMLYPAADCRMHLPAAIGDYTDFYVGIHHARNIGKLFRPDNPLLPNYKHVPIGYHGRASSVRPSGEPVTRPNGQRKAPDADAPIFAPSARLDYELELGIWIGQGNALGQPIAIADAPEHIAGFCLLNDWSARDMQAWEYVPLGPFLAKSFQTTISPWIITAEAMAPFRQPQLTRPEGDPQPLPYLWDEADQAQGALSIELEVHLSSARMRENGVEPVRLSQGVATTMYWTAQQIVTHHASNGCNLSAGDLLGTGTLSMETREGFGSLMELTEGGKVAISLPGGEERLFLQDGDEVMLKAVARAEGYVPFGFGECRAVIHPAP